MHRSSLLLVATAVFGLAACSDAPTSPEEGALLQRASAPSQSRGAGQQESTIVETALAVNAATGEFSTLIFALGEAGLVDVLNGRGQYTVFAPTDAAFGDLDAFLQANYGIGILDVVANTELLTDVLLYHVKEGRRFSNSVLPARQLDMLNGELVYVGDMALEDALGQKIGFVDTDIAASNGVIHVIDTVLVPPSVLEFLGTL
jgi:uncharacterized surface protein with fasciclin (FAS1) repeats